MIKVTLRDPTKNEGIFFERREDPTFSCARWRYPEAQLAGLDLDYLEEAAPRGKHCAALLRASNIVNGRDSIDEAPAEPLTRFDSYREARFVVVIKINNKEEEKSANKSISTDGIDAFKQEEVK